MKKIITLFLLIFTLSYISAAKYTLYDDEVYHYSFANNFSMKVEVDDSSVYKNNEVYYTRTQSPCIYIAGGSGKKNAFWSGNTEIQGLKINVSGNKLKWSYTVVCHSGLHKGDKSTVSGEFTLDTTAPSITTENYTSGWSRNNITVNFDDKESGFKGYNLQNNVYSLTNAKSCSIEQDGKYTIIASDNVGNTATKDVWIDKTSPTINSIECTSTEWTNKNVSVTVKASDNLSLIESVSITSNIETPSVKIENGCYVAVFTKEGEHTVSVVAYDKAGNQSIEEKRNIKIDKSGPTILTTNYTIYSPANWSNTNNKISVSAEDHLSGVNNSTLKIVKENVGVYGSNIIDSDGIYNVEVADTVGNKTLGKICLDRTKPTIDSIECSSTEWTNKDVSVTVKASDNLSLIESVSITSNIETPSVKIENGCYVAVFTKEGEHTVSVVAYDKAGNQSIEEKRIIKIDKSEPEDFSYTLLQLKNDTNQWSKYTEDSWTNYDKIKIDIEANENLDTLSKLKYIYISSNKEQDVNANYSNGKYSAIITNEGEHNIQIKAMDNVGNSRIKILPVKIDRTAPEYFKVDLLNDTAEYKENTWINTNGINVIAQATDSLSKVAGITITSDNDPNVKTIFNDNKYTAIVKAEGENTICVTAKDNAGNIVIINKIIKIDNTPPDSLDITMRKADGSVYENKDWTNSHKIIIEAKSKDLLSNIKNIYISSNIDPSVKSVKSDDKYIAEITSEGIHTITVTSVDEAGNEKTDTVIVKIDYTAPNVPDVTMIKNDGTLYENEIWSKADYVNVYAKSDDSLSGLKKIYISSDNDTAVSSIEKSNLEYTAEVIKLGINNITITAEDEAGNTNTIKKCIKLDRTRPTLKVTIDSDYTSDSDVNKFYAKENIKLRLESNDSGVGISGINESTYNPNYSFKSVTPGNNETPEVRNIESNLAELVLVNSGNYSNFGFTVKDIAGKESETVYISVGNIDEKGNPSAVLIIDREQPIISYEPYTTYAHDERITVTAMDKPGVTELQSGINEKTYRYSYKRDYKEGSENKEEIVTNVLVEPESIIDHKASFLIDKEGDYSDISFTVEDKAGNLSEKFGLENVVITIDTTLPVFVPTVEGDLSTAAVMYYKGDVVEDGEAVGEIVNDPLTIEVSAKDTYDGGKIGVIDKYIYVNKPTKQSEEKLNLIPIEEWKDVPINRDGNGNKIRGNDGKGKIRIEKLTPDSNYLYIKVVDDAGNISSETVEKHVIYDKGVPGKPIFGSGTIPFADNALSAYRSNTGNFVIKAAETSKTGISKYKCFITKKSIINDSFVDLSLLNIADFLLYTEKDIDATECTIDLSDFYYCELADNDIRIIYENDLPKKVVNGLGDNASEEFYYITVLAVGGNKVEGYAAEEKFRIDTTPPSKLTVEVTPQNNQYYEDRDNKYYFSDETATISWNKPLDITGVKYYEMIVEVDGEEIPASEIEFSEITTGIKSEYSEKTKTYIDYENNFRDLNVSKLFKNRENKYGVVTITVIAYDYAGNNTNDENNPGQTYSFYADFTNPEFTKDITFTPDVSKGTISIDWGNAVDTGSGLDKVDIFCRLFYSENDISDSSDSLPLSTTVFDKPYLLTSLNEGCAYYITVKAYDKAKNVLFKQSEVQLGDFTIPPYARNLEVDIGQKEYKGLIFTGTECFTLDSEGAHKLKNGTISIPDSIIVREITSENPDGIILYQLPIEYESSKYEEDNLQYAVIATKEGSVYKTTVNGISFINDGFVYDISNGLTAIGANVLINPKTNEEVKFRTLTLGFGDYLKISSSTEPYIEPYIIQTDGFDIYNALNVQVNNTNIIVNANEDGTYFNEEKINLKYRISDNNVSDGKNIELQSVKTNIVTGNEKYFAYGNVRIFDNKDLILTLNNTEYIIKSAAISGNKLIVYEAEVQLPEEYEPNKLVLRNFSIDRETGYVTLENDFGKYSLTVKENGKEVIKDGNIKINQNGELVLSGVITISDSYGPTSMKNLVVTNDGVDMSQGCLIEAYSIKLFGFDISIIEALLKKDELTVTKGKLPLYGKDFIINNLRIDTRSADTVYEKGIAKETTDGGTDFGYGAASLVSNLIIDKDGVYIETLTVSVYGSDSLTSWEFNRVAVTPDGSFEAISEKPFETSIAGYTIASKKAIFDGIKLVIAECNVTAKSTAKFIKPLVLKEIKLNSTGIISGGKTDRCVYVFDGWNTEFETIAITEEGLKGKAIVQDKKEDKNYLCYLVYNDFVILSDGTINNGNISTEEGENIVVKDNFCFEMIEGKFVKNTETQKYEFVSEKPIITIPYEDGSCLEFSKITVSSNGELKNTTKNEKTITFVSMNGYSIETRTIIFKNGKVVFTGKIAPDGWTKITSSKEIILYPDFTAEVVKSEDSINYTYAEWDIKGCGVEFGREFLTIDSNIVKFKKVELELGKIVYYADGSLYDTAVNGQNSKVNILSPDSLIKETRFNDEGLYVSMDIVFPQEFGGSEIEYNSIKFYQDGKFFADINIEHKAIDLGFMNFDLNYLSLSDEGLYIDEASINIPELENLTIGLEGLSISSNGQISLNGAVTSPFKLFNMVFCINNLSFNDNLLDFSGTVSLPNELPTILSGRTVGIRKFQIGLNDGKVKALDARLEGDYVIPFLDQWSMSLSSVGIAYKENAPSIVLDQAKLIVPSGYGIESLEINKVALVYDFNVRKFDFDFDKIQANLDVKTELSGITFRLSKVSVTKDLTFGFGGNAYFGSSDFPEFLYKKSVEIRTFEIQSNGNIGNIDIALEGLNGKVAPNVDVLELKDGAVRVKKLEDNALFVSVSGALQFTDKAIPELKGTALRLENFEIDTSKGIITELKAYNSRQVNGTWSKDPATINWDPVLFGNKFNDVFISFEYDGENKTGEVTLAGGLILPSTLPQGISGSEVRLDIFTIGLDGNIKAFAAKYSTDKTAIGAVDLTDVDIKIEYKDNVVEYDIGSTLTLNKDKFPEGIGGTSTKARFVFTSNELKLVDCSCSIPDQKLMNTLGMSGVKLALKKTNGAAMSISLAGALRLPASFPEGLAGMELKITELTMKTDGTFDVVNVGLANINAKLFNQLQLSKGSVNFTKGTGQEFLINVGGQLRFVGDGIPEELKATSFGIDELTLSTKKGLVSFSAGMTGNLKCQILGGLDLSINKLWFTKENFTISATAGLNFPAVKFEENPTFAANVTMSWDGEITNFTGGLESISAKVAGFTGSIKKLYVTRPTPSDPLMVTLGEFRITLPDNLGSMANKSLALKNATFNPSNGKFNGDIEVPSIETTIVGFTLVLDGPSLNFTSNSIGFTKVAMKLPSFLGNASVALYDVNISKEKGLTFGGGAFTLPDFKVGELGFKNVGAKFMLNGSQYYINGHGGVNIPGAGMLEAQLSFTNKSDMYPIGLERAYFSYEIATGGIPLGSTGLYLSGIRGCLAYGPPKEVPETYRGLFGENGTRLQLGLTVKDQTGGSMARVLADTWIDVTKLAWAFQGDATILSGTLNINAYVYAAITKNVFATGMKVQILFVKGKIEVYIFGLDGQLKFSGCGEVSFGMPKGYLCDGILTLPKNDIWLGGFGCQFGDFTNGKRGFLAYIEINIGKFNLGKVGAFVGSGGLDIKVKNYDILRPAGISFNQLSLRTPVVNLMELPDENSKCTNSYKVNITGGKQRSFIPFETSSASAYANEKVFANNMNNETVEDDDIGELEKTVFILGFTEGDPEFILHSPSGKEYRAGDPGVTTEYIENGILIDVESPETGSWTITVNNLEEGQFELVTLGVESTPEVSITEPADGIFAVTDQMYVKGSTTNVNSPVYIYASEDTDSPTISIGYIMSDEYGNYEGYISTKDITDGDYILSARVLDSEGMDSPAAFSAGKYRIDRSSVALNAPANLRTNEIAKQKAKIVWDNTNGSRTGGYILRTVNKTTGIEDESNVGNINEISIPYYPDGTELEFSVCTYDDNGKTSEYTTPLTLTIGGNKTKHNIPKIENNVITVDVERGNSTDAKVFVTYDDWSTEETYILSGIKEEEKPFVILTREQLMELDDSRIEIPLDITFQKNVLAKELGNNIKFNVFASEDCAPGEYTYECSVINENNYNNCCDFTVIVNVKNPKIKLQRVIPSKINGTVENEITVFGSGFVSGSKFYLNGQELIIPDNENNGFGTKTLRTPVLEKRGIYTLTAEGVEGDTKELDLTVAVPDYDVNLYMSKAKVRAGKEIKYPLSATGFDGYTGTATFRLKSAPKGFSVYTPQLEMNETGYIIVETEPTVATGEYSIILETGNKNEFTLTVFVTNDAIEPTISSVAPARLYTGLETTIYGYGFADQGMLLLNGKEVTVNEWTDQYIKFTVPTDTGKGICSLIVKNENGQSDEFFAKVYENGFNVRIMKDTIQVNSGEQETVTVAITGYAENIDLSVSKDPNAPFTATLSKYNVSTNAVVDLVIEVENEIETGKYPVTIMAVCGNSCIEKSIDVEIRNPFTITTEKLPKAYLGVPYSVQLENTEPETEVLWQVEQGTLPAGLSLSGSGLLSGVPEKQTTNTVMVTAKKLNGIKASRKYTISIEDDIWYTDDKNAGLTRSVISEIPANSQVNWISENASGIEHLYAQGTCVVALTENGARVFDTNGAIQWTTDDQYKQSFITKEIFYGITRGNRLEARSLITGLTVWERKNVSSMISNGSILITKEGNNYYRIDIDNGTISESVSKGFHTVAQTIWSNDTVYEWKKNSLVPLYGSEKSFKTGSTIYTAAADNEGFVIITSNDIIVTDTNFEIIKKMECRNTKEVKIALTASELYIQDNETVVKYDRNTLDVIWAVTGGNNIVAANEKLVITDDNCIRVLNGYTGKEIWSEEGNYSTIAIYKQNLYAAKESTLIAYNGTYNASAPEINIVLNIENPDGTNEWYKTMPLVTIAAEDKETYVDEIKYSNNGIDWKLYEQSFAAKEGNNFIEAYALDSKSLKSETIEKTFKVDTIKPVTTFIPSIMQNENGWYDDSVYVHLESEDKGSGVAVIETNYGKYEGAIAFTEEGEYILKWCATDNAGNVEDTKSTVIKVDKYAPVTQSSVKSDKGITVVTVSSWDSGSGIAYTEYCVDQKEVKLYEKPVVMLDEGWHKFEWRTFDVSGKTSDWQGMEVYVQKDNSEGNVLALTELNGEREAIEYPLTTSSTLFVNNFTGNARIDKVTVKDFDKCYTNFWAYNTMNAVPSYVLDSEYIKWKTSDMILKGKKTIQYYLKKDAVMYMFAGPDMEVSDTWTLIDENAHIQDNWCKDGYKLYMRRALAEECVEVPVQETVEVLPIIAVKEQPVITAELKLTRIANFEDEYYNGRKPYRSGVQLAISVEENTSEYENSIPLNKQWTVEMNGEVKPLVSNVFTIPAVEEETKLVFRYKVTAADEITEAMDVKTIVVSPADDPSEINPLN